MNGIAVKFSRISTFSSSFPQLATRYCIGAVSVLALQCIRSRTIVRQGNSEFVYGGT